MSGAELVGLIMDGSLLLAMPLAFLAGLLSFLSPCVLPLVPGYLSFITGLSGSSPSCDSPSLDDRGGTASDRGARPLTAAGAGPATALAVMEAPRLRPVSRGRIALGSVLFVAGFSAVFISAGALFGGLGWLLLEHARVINVVLGIVTVVMGLTFLGVLPALQREVRWHRMPVSGLAGAPLLGVAFGVGWTPCISTTLAAVQALALNSASAGRGALLSAVYCLGLGLPFVLSGLALDRALGAFAVVRRHSAWVMRAGGAMLVILGLLLITGYWDRITIAMRGLITGFTLAV